MLTHPLFLACRYPNREDIIQMYREGGADAIWMSLGTQMVEEMSIEQSEVVSELEWGEFCEAVEKWEMKKRKHAPRRRSKV